MRVLLCLLLFLSSVSAQTTDIDLTVLQEFKIIQDLITYHLVTQLFLYHHRYEQKHYQ